MDELTDLRWRKSSHSSGSGGDCVEVAAVPGRVATRDSKNPEGSALVFRGRQWTGFLDTVKAGTLDPR